MLKKVIIMGLLLKKIFGARSAPKIFFLTRIFSPRGIFQGPIQGGGTLIEWSNFAFQGGDNPVFSQGRGRDTGVCSGGWIRPEICPSGGGYGNAG